MSDTNSNFDWIYILLTIVAGGISYIRSQIKKNQSPSSARPIPEETYQEGNGENVPEDKYQEYEDELVERYPFTKSVDKTYSFTADEEGRASEKEMISSPQEEAEESEISGFDLKKAIIYNEILNRKYT